MTNDKLLEIYGPRLRDHMSEWSTSDLIDFIMQYANEDILVEWIKSIQEEDEEEFTM